MAGVSLEGYDEIQVELMNEKCILVDENDQVIGSDTKKRCNYWSRCSFRRKYLFISYL